jgi:hypothetical protein
MQMFAAQIVFIVPPSAKHCFGSFFIACCAGAAIEMSDGATNNADNAAIMPNLISFSCHIFAGLLLAKLRGFQACGTTVSARSLRGGSCTPHDPEQVVSVVHLKTRKYLLILRGQCLVWGSEKNQLYVREGRLVVIR